jgi:glutamate dehydrogenase/leucine dehydrogenase
LSHHLPTSVGNVALTVTEQMADHGHEQVVFAADSASGLRAVIAIHSTALGPALGGVRFWHYPDEDDAVVDALRLSEAMTLKASVAGLHQGGGKAVVLVEAPDAPHPEPMLRAMGLAIDELGGRYLAAEDVGASPHDMDVLALETPWVTGVDPANGGSGDPSPVTAHGVVAAMRAVVEAVDGSPVLEHRRVAVQGVGHVGAHLVQMLVDAGASVVVSDLNEARAREIAGTTDAGLVANDRILEEECDVFAPCALGAVLTAESVARLRCQAVCGAANNQLADADVDDLLLARGIVYGPDFVANAGGIINIAEEFTGYSRDRAWARAAEIEDTMRRVLTRSRADGVAPGRVAVAMGRERIASEGDARRWRPGDPAAWTSGHPMRGLRPQGTQ